MLLERLRIRFETASPDADETLIAGESCEATAVRLAEAKARSLATRYPDALIIGSDQVADLDGTPLGKPGTFSAAMRQLIAMRGRRIVFHTAVALFDARDDSLQIESVPTTVHMRNLNDDQLGRYLELDQPYDCAGSAKVESLGIALTERIESTDPTALIGLPLIALTGQLTRVRFPIF